MSWDWVIDLAADPRVKAAVLVSGFVLLLLIGRYGGNRE